MSKPSPSGAARTPAYGLLVAVTSAVCFGTSGPLAKGLIDSGWSSAAVTAARLGLGSLLLVIPLILLRRRLFRELAKSPLLVVAYGVLGVAVVQLSFFNAVRYLDVPVALLIEYSGLILVVAYDWLIRGRKPTILTGFGCVTALTGLVVVILGGSGIGDIDPVGLVWAIVAGVGLASYFILATEDFSRSGGSVDPLALAAGGLMLGTIVIAVAGVVGLLPMSMSTDSPMLADTVVPWWLVALAIAGISTSLAYVTGVTAVRLLGATPASFVALIEVVASAVASWWLLGQTMAAAQLVGAAVLLAGLVAVNLGGRPRATSDESSLHDPSLDHPSLNDVEGGRDDAVGVDPVIGVDVFERPGLTKTTDP
ncbi:EamA family transporter [Gordonia rubripertincta]|uniref:DMT family transporter n=1 Tax=Gordonia rubripertincta TaxID=36822 RepID=A0ABT4MZY5_GORRU|nr:DMT family transporter [Gordonia rubripertincta]MCZ4552546.1 DMT family transporter [Gordonia rubripertincta]